MGIAGGSVTNANQEIRCKDFASDRSQMWGLFIVFIEYYWILMAQYENDPAVIAVKTTVSKGAERVNRWRLPYPNSFTLCIIAQMYGSGLYTLYYREKNKLHHLIHIRITTIIMVLKKSRDRS
ncbi:hypothetical protein KI387_019652, partial [Taxus chinensis]